ncbi:hypothetical protein CB0940_03533 [Cercospora beticola]|uniref:Uncharacterized protein n=1 Tax=Cercospora beticola TaxID=122368 RepID=A0A2G5I3D5_CERBT|nr:hypothetical protein CB0940_03533 [Cercospora beticola]PIA99325.1 hypothetical protein CB0940_03533 [Cercospora beticola]WPB00707.1 hypothetical protein RHO25_005327 [Cercospora beticola]
MLLSGQHVLKLSSNIVQLGVCSNVIVSLDEDPRIELLSDLFQDSRAPELILIARVKLTILQNCQGSGPTDEQIQHPRWHDVTDDYRILRIGSVPLRNGDEAEMAEKVCDHRREGIAYMQALTVWMDRKSGGLHLRRCHAFDFDDFCIGNAFEDTQWNQRAFSNRDYFLGRLQNVQCRQGSKEDFVQLLEQSLHDEDEDAQMGSGIPLLPTYCYNKFRPAQHGLGLLSWPKRGIDVAATFVDRYGGVRNLKFPQDIRIIVEEKDSLEDVIECLLQEINRQGWEHGTYFNSARLFRAEHRGKWKVKLWIMPQTNQRKMYQYHSGNLLQFLSPAITDVIEKLFPILQMDRTAVRNMTAHLGDQLCSQRMLEPVHELVRMGNALIGKTIMLHVDPETSSIAQAADAGPSQHATNRRSVQTSNRGKGLSAAAIEAPATGSGSGAENHTSESVENSSGDEEPAPDTGNDEVEAGSDDGHRPFVDFTFKGRKWSREEKRWRGSSNMAETQISCSGRRLPFDFTDLVSDLILTCRNILQRRINRNEELVEAAKTGRLSVPFRASIEAPNALDMWVSLSDDRFNVRQLRDLFRDLSQAYDLRVHVIFDVQMSKRLPKDSHERGIWQPLYKPFEVVRVGNKKKAKKAEKPKAADEIDPERPLLAWRCAGKNIDMELFSMHAYDFGKYCIGDADSLYVFEEENFGCRRTFLKPFDGIKTCKEFQQAIKRYLKQEPLPKVGSGVPFIPSYCFNNVDASNFDGTKFGIEDSILEDESEVEIFVRCVNHLPSPEEFGERTDFIDFPESMSVKAAPHNEMEEVWKAIADELQAKDSTKFVGFLDSTRKDKKKLYASAALWQEPFEDTWNKQLWVSPQLRNAKEQDRRMYLFANAKAEEGELPIPLSRFLNRRLWNGGDHRLYAEVHFLPKRLGGWPVTGTIVGKAPPLPGQASTANRGANAGEEEDNLDEEMTGKSGEEAQIEEEEEEEEIEDDEEDGQAEGEMQ